MVGDWMELSGMGSQVLEKGMFDPHPRLPKWEEGYQGMGDSDNWAAYGPWWQTNDPVWGQQPLYSGMGQAAQGTWLSPSQVAPSEIETAAQLTTPHPAILAAVKAARRRRRSRGMGDWMELSGIAETLTSPLGMILIGGAALLYMARSGK